MGGLLTAETDEPLDLNADTRKRVCLIEPRHNHEEVAFPIVSLLRDHYEVHVIAPQSLLDVDLLRYTRHLFRGEPIEWDSAVPRWRRLGMMRRNYALIREIVDAIAPEFVIFNSTYSLPDLLQIVTTFRGVRKVQVIHEFRQFLWPGMRRLFAQFDLNLVISEDVQRYVVGHHPEFSALQYVLPIHFDGFLGAEGAAARSGGEVGGGLRV